MSENTKIILGKFNSAAELLHAAEALKENGYTKFDCHSPFPIHGMDKAMGLSRSKLGFIVGGFAAFGLIVAILLQWYASTIAYPIIISGKPFFSYQAYLPVTFALAVLLSAISALVGMLALNKLPRWNHPLFESELFKSVTDDGFFVSIDSDDKMYDERETYYLLSNLGVGETEIIG